MLVSELAPWRGWGRWEDRDTPCQAQPCAQVVSAGGWKVPSEAGSGLAFAGGLML